jgi:acyl-CoA synthetase (NDP forming)
MSTPTPARAGSTRTLSEYASKQLVRSFGVPVVREKRVADVEAAVGAAAEVGFPVVVKLCGERIAHKTERGLVRLGLSDTEAVREAATELLAAALPEDGDVELLVAEQVGGRRELIAGLVRDPQFGPCVLLGLGGILAEAVGDAVFAAAPIDRDEAARMMERLGARKLLGQPFRGEPPVDVDALAEVLVGLSRLGLERPEVMSVDLNPLIVRGDRPVAVDALVEVAAREVGEDDSAAAGRAPEGEGRGGAPASSDEAPASSDEAPAASDEELLERFRPLFHPRGIAVAGVASHPGKFGFATLHNLLRFGFQGEIFPLKPDGAEVLGRRTLTDVSQLPEGRVDLVFVCTPTHVNIELLRACAAKGARAAFVASAGYGEAGEEGKRLQRQLVETADELGMLLIGPNGQGVISTASSMCAQIVAPYPPPGRIGVASQSGNLVSSYLNYAVASGVGVSKAVSLGNSAQTSLADVLEYFAVDPDTDVALAYVEGVGEGQAFKRAVQRLTARKPLVLVKGGAGAAGQRAAASHTGALASDDRIFGGLCKQYGVLRAPTVEEAFEWAATLATQPLPRGRRTVVFTTVGGWGVLAADACSAAGLDLIELPEDIKAVIDTMVPARWSRNNPIDLASGETRDTVSEVLELLCAHAEIDAVIHLGVGIQAAQAGVFKSGEFYPEHGLDRIVGFHEKQDRRYAAAARDASQRHGVPVLSATELISSDRDNPGVAGIREGGRVCHPSAHRAVGALRALVDYAEFRARRKAD